MIRWATWLLFFINALLLGVLGLQWIEPDGQRKVQTWVPPAPMPPEVPKPQALAPSVAAPGAMPLQVAVLERPLFAPDRRPPPPAAEAIAPPPPPPDPLADLQIVGVFLGQADRGVIVRQGQTSRYLRVNDVLSGWTLSSLQERQAVFSSNGQDRMFTLNYAKLGVQGPETTSALSGAAPPQPLSLAPNRSPSTEEERQAMNREILRKRNELRAKLGMPLLTE